MQKRAVQGFAVAAIVMTLVGCGASTEPSLGCDPPVPPYSIYVAVQDSATGRWLAVGTTGTIDSPTYHDTLETVPGDSVYLYARHNVPGTYHVQLHRTGYRDWAQDSVAVVWGRCGGGNVRVVARLQSSGG